VITEKDLPKFASINDFRDPKIFKSGGVCYSIVASKAKDNTGQILLFTSSNMITMIYQYYLKSDSHIELEIFLDTSSIEIFVNQGEKSYYIQSLS